MTNASTQTIPVGLPIDPEDVERSQTLFYLLTLFLTIKSKAFKKIKSCRNKNGFEAWRLLLEEYEPRTRGRQGAILDALLVATFPLARADWPSWRLGNESSPTTRTKPPTRSPRASR